ncbi:MAG: hypothetical protein ACLRFE_04085 [Clostridia bacterium]
MKNFVTTLKVEDMTKASRLKQLKYAKVFSEGSEDLKQLLMYMWNNDINTFSTCAGHEPSRFYGIVAKNYPYILFDISNFSNQELRMLLVMLLALNQLYESNCYEIDIDIRAIDEYERKNKLVHQQMYERHALKIAIHDYDRKKFSELLNVIEAVKNHDHKMIEQLKQKLDNNGKSIDKFSDFVNVATEINNSKVANNPYYSRFELEYDDNRVWQRATVTRPENTEQVLFKNSKGKCEILEVAKGYATLTSAGTYVIVVDNGLIELSNEEIEGFKIFDFDKKDLTGELNVKAMQKALEKANSFELEE